MSASPSARTCFNLAALLGVSALIAGADRPPPPLILLEGSVGLWIALVGLAVVVGPARSRSLACVLALAAFVPYVGLQRRAGREPAAPVSLPGGWSAWLARALAEDEHELEVAIRPAPGRRPGCARGRRLADVAVIIASVVMEESATDFGPRARAWCRS